MSTLHDGVSEEYELDLGTLFPLYAEDAHTPAYFVSAIDIACAVLRACLRSAMFGNVLDSTELIQMIQDFDEAVYVSPSDRAPKLINNIDVGDLGRLQRGQGAQTNESASIHSHAPSGSYRRRSNAMLHHTPHRNDQTE